MTGGPAGPAPEDRLYFPELDGLRFVAFGLVFLFHQGVPWPELSGLVGASASRALRENGWVGVQLFFLLSGYLITTLLLREEAAFGRVDLRAFWVRRVLRIWPLYYLTVFLTFVLMPWVDGGLASSAGRWGTWRHLPWFLGFLGNWSMIAVGPVGSDAQSVLWSVCVEEQFYLFVPLIVARVGRRFRVPVVLALIASAVATRAVLGRSGANQLSIQYNTFAQADTLLAGVLLALWLGPEPRGSRLGRWLTWGQWGVFGLAVWVVSWPRLAHGHPREADVRLRRRLGGRGGGRRGRGDGPGPLPPRPGLRPARLAGEGQLRPLHVPRGRVLAPGQALVRARLVPEPGDPPRGRGLRHDGRARRALLRKIREALPAPEARLDPRPLPTRLNDPIPARERTPGP